MTAPTPSALAFHRLAHQPFLRQGRYAGWKPALELLTVLALFFLIQAVYFVVFLVIGLQREAGFTWLIGVSDVDAGSHPLRMLFDYGAVASTGLAALIAAVIAGRKSGALWSIAGKIRWNVLGTSMAAIAGPAGVCFLLDLIIFGAPPTEVDPNFWLAILLLCVVIPLQCTAEELIFRGSLPQIFGAWFHSPLAAYGCAVPFFVFGHTYDIAGLAFVTVFAVLGSVLVHRTGGLEAAIVLHATNNMTLSYTQFSGIGALVDIGERDEFLIAAVLAQYLGAALLLLVLRKYSPAALRKKGLILIRR